MQRAKLTRLRQLPGAPAVSTRGANSICGFSREKRARRRRVSHFRSRCVCGAQSSLIGFGLLVPTYIWVAPTLIGFHETPYHFAVAWNIEQSCGVWLLRLLFRGRPIALDMTVAPRLVRRLATPEAGASKVRRTTALTVALSATSCSDRASIAYVCS